MNWTEIEKSNNEGIIREYITCETPLGKSEILKTTQGESFIFDITINGKNYIGFVNSFEDGKELVKKYLIKINNELTEFLKPIKRCLQCNNYIEKSSRPKKFCNERCSSKFRLQKKKNQFFRQLQELEFNVNGIQLKGKYLSTIAESVIKIEVTYDESEVTEVGATANVHQSFLVR
jgi:hypothetical protein